MTCRTSTLAGASDEAAEYDWCFFVNLFEIATAHGELAGATRAIRSVMRRCRHVAAVALECSGTPWFMHSVRLCRDAGIETLLDLGFHSQSDGLEPDVAAMYRFCFNGLTPSEVRAVPADADESQRPVPWALVGHQSVERSDLAYRLVREAQPDGFLYLPRLSPVTDTGPHLNERQYQHVLSRARFQVWCAHHPHFYLESERFRNSLLTGSLPVKVVSRPPERSRVFPFEHLLVNHEQVATFLRETGYAPAWRRFRDEFLALPTLAEGMAAFLDVPVPREVVYSEAGNVFERRAPGASRAAAAEGVLLADQP
jgi:hypothetical protein